MSIEKQIQEKINATESELLKTFPTPNVTEAMKKMQDLVVRSQPKPAINIQEMDELLQSNFNEFRLAIGLPPDNLSERAKEYFRKAMEEYSKKQLLKFCDHLNTYKGFEDCRFDFMLIDFKQSV